MAAQKNARRQEQRRVPTYVEGNTVRKAAPAVRPHETRPARPKRPKISHRVRRNQERALYMDLPYVIALTVAAFCSLYICVSYIHVQSSITARIHTIEGLEKKLETLRSENDGLETRINTGIDLEHIYRVATEELGMGYANKGQVILYDRTESEYVIQNEDISKH